MGLACHLTSSHRVLGSSHAGHVRFYTDSILTQLHALEHTVVSLITCFSPHTLPEEVSICPSDVCLSITSSLRPSSPKIQLLPRLLWICSAMLCHNAPHYTFSIVLV